jgi:hypothetical protein
LIVGVAGSEGVALAAGAPAAVLADATKRPLPDWADVLDVPKIGASTPKSPGGAGAGPDAGVADGPPLDPPPLGMTAPPP